MPRGFFKPGCVSFIHGAVTFYARKGIHIFEVCVQFTPKQRGQCGILKIDSLKPMNVLLSWFRVVDRVQEGV